MQLLFSTSSLTDLIKGIRSNSHNEKRYISSEIDQIRSDIKSSHNKPVCLEKLAYLVQFGYDMKWAEFYVIEVMADSNPMNKRVGYNAASIAFSSNTSVLTLATNQIRKDLNSSNYLNSALALNTCGQILTPDLSRDLVADITNLLNHSRSVIRKRAVLVLYKIFLKYPESLKVVWPKVKEKLQDPDPSVAAATVNLVCELSKKNPKSYIMLAPVLFDLLLTKNNWMLIKIVKLFGYLIEIEPRLVRKLAGPFYSILRENTAISVIVEIINICITGGFFEFNSEIKIVVLEKLKTILESDDVNLQYLGLISLGRLIESGVSDVALEYTEIVMSCLSGSDPTLAIQALKICCGMIQPGNVVNIVNHLVSILDKKDFSGRIVEAILDVCCKDLYSIVEDELEWFITTLVKLAPYGQVGSRLIDICLRVEGIREYAVGAISELFLNDISCVKDIGLVAWPIGEYLTTDRPGLVQALVDKLINAQPSSLNDEGVGQFITCGLKLCMRFPLEIDMDAVLEGLKRISTGTFDLEVYERAQMGSRVIEAGTSCASLFEGTFSPVSASAQSAVPVPEGIDLNEWINPDFKPATDQALLLPGALASNDPLVTDPDEIPVVKLDLGEINMPVIVDKKERDLFSSKSFSKEAKKYIINRQVEDVMEKQKKMVDADTLAVASIDLTQMSDEDGNSAEVIVTRKKEKKKKRKKKAAGDSDTELLPGETFHKVDETLISH